MRNEMRDEGRMREMNGMRDEGREGKAEVREGWRTRDEEGAM